MFYAFDWFSRVQLYGLARRQVIKWFETNQPLYYLNQDFDTPTIVELDEQALTAEAKIVLEYLLDQAWDGIDFGGFIAGKDLAEIKGYCHFTVNNAEAILNGLAFEPDLKEVPLLQSPVLHAALTQLINEKIKVERIRLPFAPTSEADYEYMAIHSLYFDAVGGYWQMGNKGMTADDLLKHYQITSSYVSSWLEISLSIEANQVAFIAKVLEYFSYKKGVIIERPIKVQLDGLEMLDELAPVDIKSYIEDDENASTKIGKLSTFLNYVSLISPISQIEVTGRGSQEWNSIWDVKNKFRAGRQFIVKLPEDDYSPKDGETVVSLNSHTSVFGITTLGLHPSTRLPVELMERYIKPDEHRKMLDIGIGTGILAIVAAHLGVEKILGVDAHPPAVANARENINLNGMSHKIQAEFGSLAVTEKAESYTYSFTPEALQPPPTLAAYLPFDIIISNTYDHIHVGLAQPMFQALRPGGLLITSGIIVIKADEVAAALEQNSFKLLERKQNGNWVAFVHQK
jgi:ribosomal protein L11 methyltransferase